ncbi:MAG: YbjQ family protein [Lactobacillaceae bacterium]|jgi:uncharacterized protein YbjQ (UPF0145 family)|nr:YbjQ family protein [Lactobacillaceae bacterium]
MALFGGSEDLMPMFVGEHAEGTLGVVSGFGMSADGALKDMNKAAEKLGATAVVNVRFTGFGSNVLAFGDAVK